MSPQGVTIEVPIPYEMELAKASGTGSSRVRVREVVSVNVDSVEAPVALTATYGEGESVVRWREHAGALWRPFFRTDNLHSDKVDLEGLRSRLQTRTGAPWRDDPFASLCDFGRGALKSREEILGGGRRRLIFDGREAAVEAARALATDIVLIDGEPHRKAPAPVWTVGMLQIYSMANSMVRLVAPDLEADVLSPFTFPFDAVDEAVTFAESAREAFGARAMQPVTEEWTIESSIGSDAPDADESDRRTWRSFMDCVSSIQIGRLPGGLLPLIGEGQASFDAKDGDRLFRALASLEDGLDPLKAAGYPGAGILLKVRGLYLESRRQLDDDDAFALSTVI